MKKTTKTILTILIVSVLVFMMSLSAFAEGGGESLATDISTDSYGQTSVEVPEEDEGIAEKDDTGAGDSVEEDESSGNLNETVEKNPFATVFNFVKEHATEIFSVMTFIGSLILAFAYKRGLLPMVQSSLGAIGGAVTKIKESTDSESESAALIKTALGEGLGAFEEMLKNANERLDCLTASLNAIKEDSTDKEKMRVIMNAQIDMLYDLFMSSALPQYQKEAVGEKVHRMKEALAEGESN